MSAVLSPAAAAARALEPIPPEPDRSKFLGGSDVAAVMGLSPWSTPVELWMQKTGRMPREEPDAARQRMFDRGHKLEPFIRDMVIQKLEDLGVEVELIAVNRRFADATYPFLACEIDFELRLTGDVEIGDTVVSFRGEEVNADAKSVSGFARKKWGLDSNEDVPIEYAAQFMHGLGITGRRACLVAALRSFDDVDIYWTLRDDETISAMREKSALFWNGCVLADQAPDPVNFSDIKFLFPTDNGKFAEATDDIAEKVEKLRLVRDRKKDLEAHEEFLCFQIGNFIRPHSLLKHNGRDLCTWKAQSATRLDVARLKEAAPQVFRQFANTTTTRVLRLSKKGN